MSWKVKADLIAGAVRAGLIVSCQARPQSPLYSPQAMALMARAAAGGGAVAIRADGPESVAAIKSAVTLPVFDCHKRRYPESDVYIMPTRREARASAEAGADVLVVDGTARPRPGGEPLRDLVCFIHEELGLPVMGDVSTLEEGIGCVEAGCDFIATTLSGYTPYSQPREGPDLDLVADLATRVDVPVIAEGRIRTPDQALLALRAGAWAVVVGSAITAPDIVARWFVQRLKEVHAG